MATGDNRDDNPFPDDLGCLPPETAQALHRAVRAGVREAGGSLALFQESCSGLVGLGRGVGPTVRSPNHIGGPVQSGVPVSGVQEGGVSMFPKHDTVALSIARELRNLPGDLPSTTRVCFSQLALWGAQDLHPDSKCGIRCGGALIVSRPAAAVTAPRTARSLEFATLPRGRTFSLRFSDNDVYFATSRVRGCEFALLERERNRVRTAEKKKAERESAASGSDGGGGVGGERGQVAPCSSP